MTKSIENKITAIVLAGGESTRMGRDKALLTVDKETLLSKICSVAEEVAATVYVVSPWSERYRFILPPNYLLVKEKLVLDAKSNAPIIGFAQGLKLVETKWVLLLACDLPYLSSSQVKQWSLALATVLPTQMAFLPRDSKGWQVLCGFYRRDCLASLERYIKSGGKSFQAWLTHQKVKELIPSDRNCLFNCNTPADWQRVIENSDEKGPSVDRICPLGNAHQESDRILD